jgi:hypothetical protein
MPSPVADALADFARAVRGLPVTWYVFGAQGAILRGVARLTADVDVTVLLGPVTPDDFVDALHRGGVALRVPRDDAFVAATRVFPLVHVRTGLPVDVVLGGPGLEEDFAGRAEMVDIGGVEVPVATATDLVIMKMIAGRPKDFADVASLLAIDPAIVDIEGARATLAVVDDALGEERNLVAGLDSLIPSRRTEPRR